MASNLKRKEGLPKSVDLSAFSPDRFRDQIAQKAYELYEKRGRTPGNDLQDWLEAERQVLAERSPDFGRIKTS